ncbi:MAG: radical SAM protein [Prevotella sp.]|nr:radical SAM protein [Prevotella sp.]
MKNGRSFRQRIRNRWVKLKAKLMLPMRRADLAGALTIELTNHCTLACTCCPNGRDSSHCRPKHTLAKDSFGPLLRQIDIPFSHVFLHLHGEPLLNKDLPLMVDLLVKRGVSKFTVFSNAYRSRLDVLEKMLDKLGNSELELCFSAEVYDKQAYERLRFPGSYETVWKSLEEADRLMAAHQRHYSLICIIDSQAVATLNKSVPEIFRHLPQLKDIHFSSAFPWPHLPETGDIAGHLSRRRAVCSQIWQLPVILASGEVSMCSSDYRGECIVGSLWEHTYSQLMNNRKARLFRRHIATRRAYRNTICEACLIDRLTIFSRTVRRKFILEAKANTLETYFANYNKYFTIDEQTTR